MWNRCHRKCALWRINLGIAGETVHVGTEGGPLNIYLGKETFMEGPASTVFTGTIIF